MRFKDKTAVITGAASGMGFDAAKAFASEGANVVLTDVNPETVENAAQELRDKGGTAVGVKVDVRDYEQVKGAVKYALDTYGSVDIMVNCAGGSAGRMLKCPPGEEFHNHDISVIDWGIDVNLKGTVYFAHAVMTPMLERKSGVIINLASVDGVGGSRAVEYSAAKSGVIGLTRSLAIYGAPNNVRACCISPGPVLTRAAMAKLKTRLGYAAEPEEITRMVLYLASDDARSITGSNYIIDGGRSIGLMG